MVCSITAERVFEKAALVHRRICGSCETYQEELGPPLEGRKEAAGALADEDERPGSNVGPKGVGELDGAERMALRFLEDRHRALDHTLDLGTLARRGTGVRIAPLIRTAPAAVVIAP